jgi:cyclase
MVKKRLIPVLILREGMIVQTLRFKFTNIIGDAITAVEFFNRWAADEIVILDVSRDTRKRDRFYPVIQNLSRKCFVPLTVGGWVTSTDEIRALLRCGADKVAINTEAVRRPGFITESASMFGSQCTVLAIDARRRTPGDWEVVIDRGREPTGRAVLDWAREAQRLGAGEIFLTSIDQDGSRQGYDLELMRAVTSSVEIPVIAFGGVLTWQHLVDGITIGGCDAAAAANVFHYIEHSTKKAKDFMREAGVDVRR